MITLHFNKSKSSYFPIALEHARAFSGYKDMGSFIEIKAHIKEIYEKWESYRNLADYIVKWKGTFISYNDMQIHSPIDQVRLKHALWRGHDKWMKYLEDKLSMDFKITSEESELYEIKEENIDSDAADALIAWHEEKKRRLDNGINWAGIGIETKKTK